MKKNLLLIMILAFTGISVTAKSAKKEAKMYALIESNKGNIKIELFYKEAPMTVANFVALAEGEMENSEKGKGEPYYDGLKFHRVITQANGDRQDFMIQGGCPKGTGTGDPGYKFADEFVDSLVFDEPYILAMANSGPATNGSQFFITVAPTTWLNHKHTIFGKVVEGFDVLKELRKDDVMNKVTIIREGKDAKNFNAPAVFNKIQEEAKVKTAAKLKEASKAFETFVKDNYPNAKKTASGLYYVIEKEGTGAQAVKGKQVSVHYAGSLQDGSEFDNSFKRGQPITFQLGEGQVISGWDEGIALMKEGAKYKLIIPYQLAYGENGRPPVIPAKATLIFDTELVKVQ